MCKFNTMLQDYFKSAFCQTSRMAIQSLYRQTLKRLKDTLAYSDIATCSLVVDGRLVRTASIIKVLIVMMLREVRASETSIYFYETTRQFFHDGCYLHSVKTWNLTERNTGCRPKPIPHATTSIEQSRLMVVHVSVKAYFKCHFKDNFSLISVKIKVRLTKLPFCLCLSSIEF
jgi:hypothetical protein